MNMVGVLQEEEGDQHGGGQRVTGENENKIMRGHIAILSIWALF